MSNILICHNNRADGATLAGGSWDSTLVLNNLKDGNISKVARTSSAARANTRFRADLGANYALRALALVNHNFSTDAQWRVRVSEATLDLDFTSEVLDERVTASGGANGTRVNSAGVIVAATCPRFDYDPVTLAIKGLLVEEARTNIAGTSTTTGMWPILTNVTSAASSATTPGGTTSGAVLVTRSAVVLDDRAQMNITVPNDSTTRTMSLFVQKGAAQTCGLKFDYVLGTTPVSRSLNFNRATGAIVSGTGRVDDYGAWWRVSLSSVNNSSGNTIAAVQFYPNMDGVGSAVCWGLELEQGAFPTSYIPTAGSAVTRTADSLTMTGTNFSSWFNAAAFSGLAQFTVGSGVGTQPIWSMDDNSANNQVRLYVTGTSLKFTVTTGGSTVADLTLGSVTAGSTYKAAFACAANDFAAVMTGGSVQTDTSGALPTADRARIGSDQAGNYFDGWQQSFKAYPRRLSNTELQDITSDSPTLDYDSGWVSAKQLTFHGDTPTGWGSMYPALAAFDEISARYLTVEIDDTANTAGYVQIGRLFVGDGLQPTYNPTQLTHGWEDLSSKVAAVSGKEYGTERRRRKVAKMSFSVLTEDEGDEVHELQAEVGILGEVLYVPDPDDMAYSQRYGCLATMSELSPLDNPFYQANAVGFGIKEKL